MCFLFKIDTLHYFKVTDVLYLLKPNMGICTYYAHGHVYNCDIKDGYMPIYYILIEVVILIKRWLKSRGKIQIFYLKYGFLS